MLVSVFIPTYNGVKVLPQTLQSILAQSYTEMEVHCVDDGSTDDTLNLLDTYAARDVRIHVHRKRHEGIVPCAWNYIFPCLRGTFTLYLSQDDLLDPDCIEQLVLKQQETQADAVIPSLVFYEADVQHPEPQYADRNHANDLSQRSTLTGPQAFAQMLDYTIPGFALWRTDLIRQCGMPTESFNSDEGMQRIWALHCSKVAFSSTRFYYHQTPSSIVKGLSPYHYGSLLTDFRLWQTLQTVPEVSAAQKRALQYQYFRSWVYLWQQARKQRKEYSDTQNQNIQTILQTTRGAYSQGLTPPRTLKGCIYWLLSKVL